MLNEQCSKFVIRLFTFGAEYRRFRKVFCSSSLFFTLTYEVHSPKESRATEWTSKCGVEFVWTRPNLVPCAVASARTGTGQQVMSSEAVLNYRVHNCQWTAMPAQIAVICWNHHRKSTERPLNIESEIPTNFRIARRIVRVNELARA